MLHEENWSVVAESVTRAQMFSDGHNPETAHEVDMSVFDDHCSGMPCVAPGHKRAHFNRCASMRTP
jgi:hypothetical protein